MRVSFNTPASNKAVKKAKLLIDNAWSVRASLSSKRSSVNGDVKEGDDIDALKEKLVQMGCTKIVFN